MWIEYVNIIISTYTVKPMCCFEPKLEKQAVMDVAYCNLLKGSLAKVGFVDVGMVQYITMNLLL